MTEEPFADWLQRMRERLEAIMEPEEHPYWEDDYYLYIFPQDDAEDEPTADEMEEWDHERREKLARSLEY